MTFNPVKTAFRNRAKSRCLGRIPNTLLSIETNFETARKVKVLSATVVMSYRSFTFFKALALSS